MASLFPDFSGAVMVGNYRYSLWRVWNSAQPRVAFIMLNPSTADHVQTDATLRRCVSFARSWSCGSIEIVNLFAFRSANPALLWDVADPVGPENAIYLQRAIAQAHLILCAWGAHKIIGNRDREIFPFLARKEVYCLGCTKSGMSRHPLYVPANTLLQRYP